MNRCASFCVLLCAWAAFALAAERIEPPAKHEVGKVASYYLALARIHIDFGRVDDAAECYRKAVELEKEPSNKVKHRLDLATLLVKNDKLDEARKVFDEAIEAAGPRGKVNACGTAGRIFQENKKADLADEYLKKAIDLALDPRDQDMARLAYMKFLQETDRIDKVAAGYLQRLQADPKDAEALAWVSQYYLMIEDDLGKGIEVSEKLLEVRPKDTNLLEQLAVLYLGSKRADKAIEMFIRLGEADRSRYIYAVEQIACIETASGNIEKAIEWNNKMFEAGGETPERLYRQAMLYQQLRDYKRAIELLEKATKMPVQDGRAPDPYQLALIDAYQAAGRIQDAMAYAQNLATTARSAATRATALTKLDALRKQPKPDEKPPKPDEKPPENK